MATKNDWQEWLKEYKKWLKQCEAYYKQMKNEITTLAEGETDLGPGSNPPPPPPPPPR